MRAVLVLVARLALARGFVATRLNGWGAMKACAKMATPALAHAGAGATYFDDHLCPDMSGTGCGVLVRMPPGSRTRAHMVPAYWTKP